VTVLIGLTPAQTLEGVRLHAQNGGVGARLHERLIGEAGVAHGLDTIVTWNVGHMNSLFPSPAVLTPGMFLDQRRGVQGATKGDR
jgi:hypothetical protein